MPDRDLPIRGDRRAVARQDADEDGHLPRNTLFTANSGYAAYTLRSRSENDRPLTPYHDPSKELGEPGVRIVLKDERGPPAGPGDGVALPASARAPFSSDVAPVHHPAQIDVNRRVERSVVVGLEGVEFRADRAAGFLVEQEERFLDLDGAQGPAGRLRQRKQEPVLTGEHGAVLPFRAPGGAEGVATMTFTGAAGISAERAGDVGNRRIDPSLRGQDRG